MNGRERFLAACRGEPVDATPVWFMRQAGRYLPEYRKLRKTRSIMDLATTPELATEVAMQPMRRIDFDAAILFADIVIPMRAMGAPVTLEDGRGPVVETPVRSMDEVETLSPLETKRALPEVLGAIRMIREALDGEKALIGFSGAPYTLASYLIEGGRSRNFLEAKRLMHGDPTTWAALMRRLTEAVIDYMTAQAEAGADALQLFDSWAGNLAPMDYERFVLPYSAQILDALQATGVPVIHFATNTAGFLETFAGAGGDVVSVDWRVPLGAAWARLGDGQAIQGNLDPGVLATDAAAAREETIDVLRQAAGRPGHVFNLGHGVLPPTDPGTVKGVVDLVHEESRRILTEATA